MRSRYRNSIKAAHVLTAWLNERGYQAHIFDGTMVHIEPVPKDCHAELEQDITIGAPFVQPFTSLHKCGGFWQITFGNFSPADKYKSIRRKYAGHLIAVEGIDGVGKTTICGEIKSWLDKKTRKSLHPTIITSSLSARSTELGSTIGKILCAQDSDLSSETESFLILAARRDNLEKVIVPALCHGDFVITDRHMDSLTVYQTDPKGFRTRLLSEVYQVILPADITFVLDLPHDHPRRAKEHPDRVEARPPEFWAAARHKFLDIAKKSRHHHVIDATLTIKEIRGIISRHLEHYFFSVV